MSEASFHQEREPWIRAIRPDGVVETVSLQDALLRAHTYAGLAGELPTQDVAVLRLLLAVLHAVFYRVDLEGADAPVEDGDMALDRWEELWQARRFPAKPIEAYLVKYAARFDLFDEERPFYQVPEAAMEKAHQKKVNVYSVRKLNGAISESGNKVRLFSENAGASSNSLSFSEGARWLLNLNGFDDAAVKPKHDIGVGRLGKLGLVIAKGESLFETLMLNFVLEKEGEVWSSVTPVWELINPREKAGEVPPFANDQAQLLTIQSRRIFLMREGNRITGYKHIGGDYFDEKNAFIEQMTFWKQVDGKNFQPKLHDSSKALWREVSSLIGINEVKQRPGIVAWHDTLMEEGFLDENKVICYETVGVQYDEKKSSIKNIFSDSLSFRLNLLSELGASWRVHIGNEVQLCEQIANHVSMLARDLSRAAGGVSDKDGDGESERARQTFFFRVDVPFRQWLLTLDAQQNNAEREERTLAWRKELKRISLALGRELVEQAGPGAFTGRTIHKKDEQGSGTFYSAVTAHRSFIRKINNAIGRSETSGKP